MGVPVVAAAGVALVAVVAVLVSGVLSGGPGEPDPPSTAVAAEDPSDVATRSELPSKAFYKKADEICVASEDAVRALGTPATSEQAIEVIKGARKVGVGTVAAFENLGQPRAKRALWSRYLDKNRQGIELVDKLILDLETGGAGAQLYLGELDQLAKKARAMESALGLVRCAKSA